MTLSIQKTAEVETPVVGPALLSVRGLTTRFATPEGEVRAVNDVTFDLRPGETVGVVGESGSGKSQLFMSIMGLLAGNGRAMGSVRFRGKEILGLPAPALNRIRGEKISMIFQDPMTSLNPYLKVSAQMVEVLRLHKGMDKASARARAVEMLDLVRIPEARRRLDMYPHEFSGGMRQRVMIAMALLCRPDLLIADEPTTALDVTVQAAILDLMADLKREFGTSIILITHDLGVVAGLADRVMVMYAGRVIETGEVREIFGKPGHPYTQALLRSMPRIDGDLMEELPTISGQPPNLQHLPSGCDFQDRCPFRFGRCVVEDPALLPIEPARGLARAKACHLERSPEDHP